MGIITDVLSAYYENWRSVKLYMHIITPNYMLAVVQFKMTKRSYIVNLVIFSYGIT